MIRFKIAQFIALVSTLASVVGFVLMFTDTASSFGSFLVCVGFIVGAISILLGGFGKTFSMADKVGHWAKRLVPFPGGLVSGLIGFLIAILFLCCFAIIPVRKAYKENLRNYRQGGFY